MDERTIESLAQAFREYRTPSENQQLISQFVAGLNVKRFVRYAVPHRAEWRPGPASALRIDYRIPLTG